MRIEIRHIAVKRATKIAALMGFFLFLVWSPFYSATSLLGGSPTWATAFFGAFLFVLMPIIGLFYGAFLGLVAAAFYNFVASRWGGLIFTFTDISEKKTNP